MKVYINNQEVTVHHGATIIDAIRTMSESLYSDVIERRLTVYDEFGNETEPDGPLKESRRFFVRKPDTR
jgi:hypothetical protein